MLMTYSLGAGIFSYILCLPQEDNTTITPVARIPTVEARLIETHKVEYIEETVVEKEYIDVVRHVPVEFRPFSDREELDQWLEERSQSASIRFQLHETVVDCDDFAIELQNEALDDGFIISFEIISGDEYNELFCIPLPEDQSLHAINLSIIGNDVYYIEPQTGEVVHAAYLD